MVRGKCGLISKSNLNRNEVKNSNVLCATHFQLKSNFLPFWAVEPLGRLILYKIMHVPYLMEFEFTYIFKVTMFCAAHSTNNLISGLQQNIILI